MPPQLFLNAQNPATLWFLTKNKTKNGRNRKSEILFINSKNLGIMSDKTHKVFTDDDIDLISKTISSWRNGNNYHDIKGFCKSSSLKDIENKNFNLAPAKYIEMEDENLSFENIDNLQDELQKLDSQNKKYSEEIFQMLKKIQFKKN